MSEESRIKLDAGRCRVKTGDPQGCLCPEGFCWYEEQLDNLEHGQLVEPYGVWLLNAFERLRQHATAPAEARRRQRQERDERPLKKKKGAKKRDTRKIPIGKRSAEQYAWAVAHRVLSRKLPWLKRCGFTAADCERILWAWENHVLAFLYQKAGSEAEALRNSRRLKVVVPRDSRELIASIEKGQNDGKGKQGKGKQSKQSKGRGRRKKAKAGD